MSETHDRAKIIQRQLTQALRVLDFEGTGLLDVALFFAILKHFKIALTPGERARFSSLCRQDEFAAPMIYCWKALRLLTFHKKKPAMYSHESES